MTELVRFDNLSKIYNIGENEVRALDSICLTIQQGEFVAIVGQSGSGKSTLMNMLGCLDTPTSGDYFLEGYNVAGLSENQLSEIRNREIGFIFQGFNLVSSLSAEENVELPLGYQGLSRSERRRLAHESLERVGLLSRMKHRPKEMSGGQQQRVAIARAIASRPSILLADEPTGNLDSKNGVEVLQILHDLHSEGKTVILITHDYAIASQATRIIRVHDGKVFAD